MFIILEFFDVSLMHTYLVMRGESWILSLNVVFYSAMVQMLRGLYDVERQRLFYSRDIVFDESKVGMNKENKKDIFEHQVQFPSESNDTSRSDIDEYDTPPNEVQEETNNEELNNEDNEDNAPQIRRSERERRNLTIMEYG